MNTKSYRILVILLAAAYLVAGCGPGQLFGPALTLTPTPTQTPLPTATLTVAPTASTTSTPAPTASATPTTLPEPSTPKSPGLPDGLTLETAIVIQADSEFTGVPMEYQWIEEHYPGYERGGQTAMFDGDRVYDVIFITTADGVKLELYFDITSFYGKL